MFVESLCVLSSCMVPTHFVSCSLISSLFDFFLFCRSYLYLSSRFNSADAIDSAANGHPKMATLLIYQKMSSLQRTSVTNQETRLPSHKKTHMKLRGR